MSANRKTEIAQNLAAYLAASTSYRSKVRLRRIETRRILKNIIVVSISMMLLFSANQSILNLQSSINPVIGPISSAVIFGALAVSSLILPTFLIKKIGARNVLVCGLLCFIPYFASQLYPRPYTLIPTAVLLGIGAAPLWAALSTYVTHLAQVYATIKRVPVDQIIVRFFGNFYFAWQSADVWGNLITGLVISGSDSDTTNINSTNIDHCGPNFCPADAENTTRPPDSEILALILTLMPFVVVGLVIIVIFLDPLQRYGENREGSQKPEELTTINLLLSTLKMTTRINLILLIPITVWNGMEQGFIAADYTQTFVACVLGVNNIGYVMICFGLTDALFSLIFGHIMKYLGRLPIIAIGALVEYAYLFILLNWHPKLGGSSLFYILASLHGMGDAVWQTQINGLFGTLFRRHKEAAFANYRLWEAIGYVITFSTTNSICTKIKIYCLIGILTIGLIGYLTVELRQYLKRKRRGYSVSGDIPQVSLNALHSDDINDDDDEVDTLEQDIEISSIAYLPKEKAATKA